MSTVEERLRELGARRPATVTSPNLDELFRAIDRQRHRRTVGAVAAGAIAMVTVAGAMAFVTAGLGTEDSTVAQPADQPRAGQSPTDPPSAGLPSPTAPVGPAASPLGCPPNAEPPLADLCGLEIGARVPASLLSGMDGDGEYYLALTGQAGEVAYGQAISVDPDVSGGEDAPGMVCHILIRIKDGRMLGDPPAGCFPLHAPGTQPGGRSASLVDGHWWVYAGVADTPQVHVSAVEYFGDTAQQVLYDEVVDTLAVPGSPRRVWTVQIYQPHPMVISPEDGYATKIDVQPA